MPLATQESTRKLDIMNRRDFVHIIANKQQRATFKIGKRAKALQQSLESMVQVSENVLYT